MCFDHIIIISSPLRTTPHTPKSRNMEILRRPSEFYDVIRERCIKANHHIILAFLYIGDGDLEMRIVEDLRRSLSIKRNLKVTLLFDFSRFSRKRTKTVDALEHLSSCYSSQFSLLLLKMPQVSSFLPHQINEITGVFHCKFGVFDDYVLLTGANLSHEYFTARQDRYMLFNCKENYANNQADLVEAKKQFTPHIFHQFVDTLRPFCTASASAIGECQASHSPDDFRVALGKVFGDEALDFLGHTVLVPLVQHAQMGVEEEAQCIKSVFDHLIPYNTVKMQSSPNVLISSPYPSFTTSFVDAVRRYLAKCEEQSRGHSTAFFPSLSFITASTRSHGFTNGGGIKSLLPRLHLSVFADALSSLLTESKDYTTTNVFER